MMKRTNILFEEETLNALNKVSRQRNVSMGAIVRQAVQSALDDEIRLHTRQQALDHILKVRPQPAKGKIDYKGLINDGRKY